MEFVEWKQSLQTIMKQNAEQSGWAGTLWQIEETQLFAGNYDQKLFEQGLTPTEALATARKSFDEFLDSEYADYALDCRQWDQANADMDVTDDGYPTPYQYE